MWVEIDMIDMGEKAALSTAHLKKLSARGKPLDFGFTHAIEVARGSRDANALKAALDNPSAQESDVYFILRSVDPKGKEFDVGQAYLNLRKLVDEQRVGDTHEHTAVAERRRGQHALADRGLRQRPRDHRRALGREAVERDDRGGRGARDAERDTPDRVAPRDEQAADAGGHVARVAAEVDLGTANLYEQEIFGACFATADQKEGMAAFLGKRPAAWSGR
jgi:hypothetical protein